MEKPGGLPCHHQSQHPDLLGRCRPQARKYLIAYSTGTITTPGAMTGRRKNRETHFSTAKN
jgi:hypothetical protein